jgi:two-component system response regulator GlrR
VPWILLIDDDPAVCESLRRVLATEGWRVTTARTGADALERLHENEPDLMITDLCMKPVNGWDLLFHERLQRPHLPIFVITALSRQAANGAAQFAAEFFQKPVDLDDLLATTRRYLEGSHSDGPTRQTRTLPHPSRTD